MELVYNIMRRSSPRREWKQEDASLCRLSSSNIIVFCSTVDLHSDVFEDQTGVECQYHIYVCDIDRPWVTHKVVSCKSKVVALEWHVSGTRLLIATLAGKCQIWHMENYMLNKWEEEATADLPGEEIISLAWFHLGSKAVFNGDKKESPIYHEKISKVCSKPTVTQFGGRALDGWIAITASGMVGVAIPKAKGNNSMIVKMESLIPGRTHLQTADISFNPNGEVGVITTDGLISSCILCFMISIKVDEGCISIKCEAAPSIYMKCFTTDNGLKDSFSARVTHVKYVRKDATDSVIVGAGDHNSSYIELWKMTVNGAQPHRFFANKAQSQMAFQKENWVYHSSIHHCSLPISIAIPRFPIVYQVTETNNQMFQYLAVAYKDGSVKLINNANFVAMATTNLDMGLNDAPSEKRRKMIAHLSVMEQTVSGCALVGVDQFGTMYVMKVVNTRDPVTHVQPLYLVGMLEYNIVAGYDWWDVLPALKSVVDGVCQKLQDNFNKQPPHLQDVYLNCFLALKSTLFRCTNHQQHKAADCHCILVLNCIKSHFNMILRPKGMASVEAGPLEKLAHICQKTTEADLEKVVISLNQEHKEFVVDNISLQSLQPMVQWVADISLYLLATVPSVQGYGTFPGASLLNNPSFLANLRELIVVAYIWGMVAPCCLPHFTQSSSGADCMQRLFSLVTQLWVRAKEARSNLDFEDSLIDECCLLTSHLAVPQLDQGMFGNIDFQKNIFLQPHPVKFTYGETPDFVSQESSVTLSADGQHPSLQKKDVVRLINLGVHPLDEIRVCSRCSCSTLLDSSSKVAALGSWDGKWQKHCLCGGHWVCNGIV